MNEEIGPGDIELLRSMVRSSDKVPDSEFLRYIRFIQRTQLDPLARQVYASAASEKVSRNNSEEWVWKLTMGVTIDGFRLIADRTGKYRGQLGPYWCGSDGVWQDVWLSDKPPTAAKVGILRSDFTEPLWALAKFNSYAAKDKGGGLSRMWARMPELMIAKVCEALGLRKAFPQELSGIYLSDELAQEEDDRPIVEYVTPQVTPRPAAETAVVLQYSAPIVEVAPVTVAHQPEAEIVEALAPPVETPIESSIPEPMVIEASGLMALAPKVIAQMVDAMAEKLGTTDKDHLLGVVAMAAFKEIPDLKNLDRINTMMMQRVIAKVIRGEVTIAELEAQAIGRAAS